MTARMAGVLLGISMCASLCGVAGPAFAAERSADKNWILRCVGCHGQDGAGAPSKGIPAFPGLLDPLYSDDQGRTYLIHVPGVTASSLSFNEIADVLNYVARRWAKEPDKLRLFTAQEVAARQKVEVKDIVALRRYLTEYFREQGIELASYPWP